MPLAPGVSRADAIGALLELLTQRGVVNPTGIKDFRQLRETNPEAAQGVRRELGNQGFLVQNEGGGGSTATPRQTLPPVSGGAVVNPVQVAQPVATPVVTTGTTVKGGPEQGSTGVVAQPPGTAIDTITIDPVTGLPVKKQFPALTFLGVPPVSMGL
jgi:hypothetical protein